MSNVSGSIRRVTLDGVDFNVKADANLNQIKGGFTTEEVDHSGGSAMKKTFRNQKVGGIGLICNAEEAEILENLSERIVNFDMTYETADGTIFSAVGQINFEGHDTDANLAAISMLPEGRDGFTRL